MRVTDPETSEQSINSGWLTAIAVLMIVLGIIYDCVSLLCYSCFNLSVWLGVDHCWNQFSQRVN